ncbi:PRC-barrel domain-containing protein [Stella sp.]|uniref:PRC-barrel domain-containing protein n=1 Tax=Stella sp. TaxID=2912054 RepID=UPI0035B4896D
MRNSMIAILAAAGAIAVAPAMAQTTMPAPTDRPAAVTPAPATPPAATAPAARKDARKDEGNPVTGMRVSKIIGTKVVNSAGENVGSVDDLVVREKDQVVMAVLSVGGFLGIGDRKVAVPWNELTFGQNRTITYNVTKEQLRAQPEFQG